jgi:hypothetical protein
MQHTPLALYIGGNLESGQGGVSSRSIGAACRPVALLLVVLLLCLPADMVAASVE